MKNKRFRINSDNSNDSNSDNSDESYDSSYSKELKNNILDKFKKQKIGIHNITNLDPNICLSDTCKHNNIIPNIVINNINTIDDLIYLGKQYNCKTFKIYKNINIRILNKIIPSLIELKELIGLDDLKHQIIDKCLYFCRGLNGKACDECIDCKLELPCVNNN